MANHRHKIEGEIPEAPHLYVITDKSNLALALPVGCKMGIIPNPNSRSETSRLVLVEVKPSHLRFRCQCNPTCTTVFTYTMTKRGVHAR